MSVTDLLERTKDYSHFFPVIDKQKYQSNAPFSIYNAERRDPSGDIAAYFGEEIGKRTSVSSDINFKYNGPKPSLSSSSSVHFAEVRTVCENIEEDEANLPLKVGHTHLDCNNETEQALKGADLESIVVLKSPLLSSVLRYLRQGPTEFVWFSIQVEFFPISSRLEVSVKKITSGGRTEDGPKFDMEAKVQLFPGDFKKQKVRIVTQETSDLLTPKVFYRGISCSSLKSLKIYLKLSQKKGFFKRPRNKQRLFIPFNMIDIQGVSTVLVKVPKSELK